MEKPVSYLPLWLYSSAVALLAAGTLAFALSGEALCFVPAFAILYALIGIKKVRYAYGLLLVMLPLSVHVEFAHNSYSLSLPSEPVIAGFAILCLMLVCFNPEASLPAWFLRHPVTIVTALQFAWLIVACIYSAVPLLSLKFLIAKSCYLLCFFLFPLWIFRSRQDFRCAFILILLPLLAYMLIIIFRHAQYGFRFFYIDAAVGSLFYKHVDYAAVISMFFPFVFLAWRLAPETKKLLRYLLAGLNLLFIAALWVTYTRAAIGGVLFGGVIATAIRWRKVNLVMPTFYIVCLALLAYFITDNRYLKYHPHFRETYMHHEFGDHLKATVEGKDMSSVERLYRWIAALRMVQDKPVTGFGPHAFYYNYKPYTLSTYRTYVSENYEQSTVHNYFLMMMVEQGLPAMTLYALLVWLVFAKAQQIYRRSKDRFYRGLILAIAASFAVFFVNNLFSEIWETDKVGPMVYLLLSFVVILDYKSKSHLPE